MRKRLYLISAVSLLLCSLIISWVWAGQVVTDSHKNWAKVTLAQEKAIGDITSPGTMAVLYFINKTGRTELDPLQKGLAYMLITDLSKVEGLQLVERAKLQALVQEMGLGTSGLVDPDTAPRVGRLLGAAHVVGGKFYNCKLEKFGIDPGILQTSDEKIEDLPDAQGLLEEFFKMEKSVLFATLEGLKKMPEDKKTVSELEKPMTSSFPALIFLFKGFNESDQGNYEMAASYYRKSLKADPGLSSAANSLKELQVLGLIGKKPNGRMFLRSLRDRTSLTDRLSPDPALQRVRSPRDVEKRQSLRPPDDVDNDGDGYTENQGDCNDADASIYPGAPELNDGIDNDCDGQTDEGWITYYRDQDGDGFGNSLVSLQATSQPNEYVLNSTDCNDADASIYPGAPELNDGIDNNCDGQTDEGWITYYQDQDGDGFGNSLVSLQATSQPNEYVLNSTDCNDADASIYPGAPELNDGIDNDCDGQTDEGWITYYQDQDGDGFGNSLVSLQATSQPNEYVLNSTDCNDNNASIYPGAPELNDGIDNNCDGQTDEGWITYYRDQDGDGFGNGSMSLQATSQPNGYVLNSTDCNDNNASIYPGAPELNDGIDNDCDGQTDEGWITYYQDQDGDGFGNSLVSLQATSQPNGYVLNSTDCNDDNASVYPGAPEFCEDGIDSNCNGDDCN